MFYIGVGIRRRVFAHTYTSELTKSGNRLKTNITKKELEAGGLRYVLFCVNKDREVCLSLEKELIQHFGRLDLGTGSLANLTAGGEIGVTGVVVSQETREKLSKIRQSCRDRTSEQGKEYWQNLTEEAKAERVKTMHSVRPSQEKLSEVRLKMWANPVYKQRLKDIAKRVQATRAEETSKLMKEKWKDPVFREFMLEKRRLARVKKLQEKSERELLE